MAFCQISALEDADVICLRLIGRMHIERTYYAEVILGTRFLTQLA